MLNSTRFSSTSRGGRQRATATATTPTTITGGCSTDCGLPSATRLLHTPAPARAATSHGLRCTSYETTWHTIGSLTLMRTSCGVRLNCARVTSVAGFPSCSAGQPKPHDRAPLVGASPVDVVHALVEVVLGRRPRGTNRRHLQPPLSGARACAVTSGNFTGRPAAHADGSATPSQQKHR